MASSPSALNFAGKPTPVLEGGGTSESSAADRRGHSLVIPASEDHGDVAPSPALVKQFITSTADDIQAPADLQGGGLVDAYRAVLAAESYQVPAPAHTAENVLLKSTEQFNSIAAEGTPEAVYRAVDRPLDPRPRRRASAPGPSAPTRWSRRRRCP